MHIRTIVGPLTPAQPGWTAIYVDEEAGEGVTSSPVLFWATVKERAVDSDGEVAPEAVSRVVAMVHDAYGDDAGLHYADEQESFLGLQEPGATAVDYANWADGAKRRRDQAVEEERNAALARGEPDPTIDPACALIDGRGYIEAAHEWLERAAGVDAHEHNAHRAEKEIRATVEAAMLLLAGRDGIACSLDNLHGELLRILGQHAGEAVEDEGAVDVLLRLVRESGRDDPDKYVHIMDRQAAQQRAVCGAQTEGRKRTHYFADATCPACRVRFAGQADSAPPASSPDPAVEGRVADAPSAPDAPPGADDEVLF